MASLFKRGKGKHVPYTIQYTDHTGKHRTVKGFTDKGLSEQLAAKLELEARLRATGLIDPDQERQLAIKLTPLADLLPIFQESLASTGWHYRKYTVKLVEQLCAACGFVALGDVRAEPVQTALRDIQRAKNLSPKTYNNYQQSLHAFGQWCLDTKRLPANPPIRRKRSLNCCRPRSSCRRLLIRTSGCRNPPQRQRGIPPRRISAAIRASQVVPLCRKLSRRIPQTLMLTLGPISRLTRLVTNNHRVAPTDGQT